MKWIKPVLMAALLLGAALSGAAWAGGRVVVGVGVGVPFGWGWGWGGPWYGYGYGYGYYPPAYSYPPYGYYGYPPYYGYGTSSPPVYIEQGGGSAPAQQPASNYWYYCSNPQGYYPYVKECPSGWQKVAPQPPGH